MRHKYDEISSDLAVDQEIFKTAREIGAVSYHCRIVKTSRSDKTTDKQWRRHSHSIFTPDIFQNSPTRSQIWYRSAPVHDQLQLLLRKTSTLSPTVIVAARYLLADENVDWVPPTIAEIIGFIRQLDSDLTKSKIECQNGPASDEEKSKKLAVVVSTEASKADWSCIEQHSVGFAGDKIQRQMKIAAESKWWGQNVTIAAKTCRPKLTFGSL